MDRTEDTPDRPTVVLGSAFAAPADVAARRTIPLWYIVAQQDRAIHPDLERLYARRMGATTTELPASHVPYLSRPAETVAVIEQAAQRAPANGFCGLASSA